MWTQTFISGVNAKQLANLDTFILNLLFEFSVEYDIQSIRDAYKQNEINKQKNAPPTDDVMQALGYK